MGKGRGHRADILIIDESIPVEEKAELEAILEEVTEEDSNKPPVYTILKAGQVVAFRLNVRELPTEDSKVLRVLNEKEDVEILDEPAANGWLSILLSDGTKGYCVEKFIK